MKLEPTDAQRIAIIEEIWGALDFQSMRNVEKAVDRAIAAANSIPEGAPVDTIARRPDGAWIAFVEPAQPGVWLYRQLLAAGQGLPQGRDADSWPVIYDPTGKTLDELHAEIDRLDKAEDSALRERDYWEETVNRILYTCSSEDEIGEWSSANDPVERFIEQFKPVKRIDPTAQQEPPKGLYGKYRVERVDGKPIRACFVLEYLDDLHANKALLEYAFSVERVNPELAKDLRAEWGKWPGRSQQEPGESLARGLDDLAAGRVSRRDDYLEPQPEPATTHPVSPESTNCVPKPRTPRVVDRLGVDEQGSLWRNRADTEFWFQDECWNFRTKDGCTSWYTAGYEPKMRIFTEILEPRVLPSLDCEEARDGTVWEARYVLLAGRREQTPGWKFQHTQDGWVYEDGSRVLSPEFLTGRGPYTEVLPDVG